MHAKKVDGETLAIKFTNRRLNNPVKLDIRLIEAEQCATVNKSFDSPLSCGGHAYRHNLMMACADIARRHGQRPD